MAKPKRARSLDSPLYTAWHPMLVALLARFLPRGFKLLSEFQLSRQPQRVDILVVRLLDAHPGVVEKLHSILDYLRAHTLIEYKGPTDDVDGSDLLTLLGYAYQYMRLCKVKDPAELCLMVVCDRLTPSFLSQVALCRAELAEVEPGIWRGGFGGFALHGVETSKAFQLGPSEHLLFPFSRAYLARPGAVQALAPEDRRVYLWLYQQVEQFKRARGAMAVKDIDVLEKSFEEMLGEMMDQLPLELRLQGLNVEERLAGLKAEERLAGLKAEERLAGLKAEERLAGLSPEERLAGLSPEELDRLKRLLQ
jgi:hypothetical protein